MIVKVNMFTVACDNCLEKFTTEDFCAWHDADEARYQADESGWHHEPEREIGKTGKHYCPDCWEYNDDDELVIKPILIP